MDRLPIDLKIQLMMTIDEFSSIYSLIRTCRSMHHSFAVAKHSILSSVLRRALNPNLLCSAMAVQHSSKLLSRRAEDIKEFVTRWQPPCHYPEPGTGLFNDLARRHTLVEWFLYDYIMTLSVIYPHKCLTYVSTMWPDEIVRIHRAFYNFQLYSVLFADNLFSDVDYNGKMDMDETREVFLDRLPPWEVEELASIHSYLHRRLSEVQIPAPRDEFSQHTTHTVYIDRQSSVGYLRHYGNREFLLSFGLDYLHTVLTADREEIWHWTFGTVGRGTDQRFLGSVLRLGTSVWNLKEDKPDFSHRLYCGDCDGPNAGWLWVSGGRGHTANMTRDSRTDMRGWGFPFWAKPRYDDWRLLEEPWDANRYRTRLAWRKRRSVSKRSTDSRRTSTSTESRYSAYS